MNWDSGLSDPNYYLIAVAATAYAIDSLEQSNSRDHLNDMNNEEGDMRELSGLNRTLLESPSVKKTSFKDYDGWMSRSISMSENSDEETNDKPNEMSELGNDRSPGSLEKHSRQPEAAVSGTDHWPAGWEFMSRPLEIKLLQSGTTRPGPEDAKADAWQKEELASIRDRYEKMTDTIEEWAMKKKNKAKQKLEKIKADLDKKAAKALKSYHSQIERIEGVAGGARAQAEENRRTQEFKAIEKANKIRSTGKLPATRLRF